MRVVYHLIFWFVDLKIVDLFPTEYGGLPDGQRNTDNPELMEEYYKWSGKAQLLFYCLLDLLFNEGINKNNLDGSSFLRFKRLEGIPIDSSTYE